MSQNLPTADQIRRDQIDVAFIDAREAVRRANDVLSQGLSHSLTERQKLANAVARLAGFLATLEE